MRYWHEKGVGRVSSEHTFETLYKIQYLPLPWLFELESTYRRLSECLLSSFGTRKEQLSVQNDQDVHVHEARLAAPPMTCHESGWWVSEVR